MPQGLQIWDSAGVLILDTSTSVLSQFDSFTAATDGSSSLPSLTGATFIATTDPSPSNPANAAAEAYVSGGNIVRDLNGNSSREVRVFLL